MIRYALKCKEGHGFESWFQSAAAFEGLAGRGLLSCAVCGSAEVEKALMAPKVAVQSKPPAKPLSAPANPVEARLAALRQKVERDATYVGGKFAEEARRIHDAQEETPIYGEANAQQVKGLLEDGVPIAPLPFVPKSKAN
ncbi:DUF1178 family protein [Jannaschia marina]|uniref:DUF1178 family protein n=1 Tax=Jannaschia marina TaxID=2741674 RepID=UPI0015CD3CD8|nr:DUF1178 family protein [Jannaschia marina]